MGKSSSVDKSSRKSPSPSNRRTRETSFHPPFGKTPNQKTFLEKLNSKEMCIAVGPAGTGKTYLATTQAAYLYKKGLIDKIVLTRPTVPTGKSIGFFPGTLEEKMSPWVAPFIGYLEEYLGKGDVENLLKKGSIEVVPFEVIRGRTFDNSFVILDEAQNCTLLEMKAFVTRHGKNSVTVINGDTAQSDLNGHGNGLSEIISMWKRSKTLQQQVGLTEFTSEDIQRSGLCRVWVEEFNPC